MFFVNGKQAKIRKFIVQFSFVSPLFTNSNRHKKVWFFYESKKILFTKVFGFIRQKIVDIGDFSLYNIYRVICSI